MIQIKNIAEKLSRGLKSRLAVLIFAVAIMAVSSAFTVAGLYFYGQYHYEDLKPVSISDAKTTSEKTSSSEIPETNTAQPPKTEKVTIVPSVPKPTVVETVVIVKPVAPAPSSSVESLTPAPSDTSPVVSESVPSGDTSANPIRVSTTTYTSSNWSGYLATGGNFTAVSGSWTVPLVTGETGIESYDGAWIGIGGVTSQDLIQVGTMNQVSVDGAVSSVIFYEILPASAMVVDMPVKAGDNISASITELSLNQWLIVLNNLTDGTTFSKNISYTSSHSSAEWVEEAPSDMSDNLLPLTNFGTINFYGCSATVDGYLYDIADIGASSVTMVAQRLPIAIPSAISGSGFSVTRN